MTPQQRLVFRWFLWNPNGWHSAKTLVDCGIADSATGIGNVLKTLSKRGVLVRKSGSAKDRTQTTYQLADLNELINLSATQKEALRNSPQHAWFFSSEVAEKLGKNKLGGIATIFTAMQKSRPDIIDWQRVEIEKPMHKFQTKYRLTPLGRFICDILNELDNAGVK